MWNYVAVNLLTTIKNYYHFEEKIINNLSIFRLCRCMSRNLSNSTALGSVSSWPYSALCLASAFNSTSVDSRSVLHRVFLFRAEIKSKSPNPHPKDQIKNQIAEFLWSRPKGSGIRVRLQNLKFESFFEEEEKNVRCWWVLVEVVSPTRSDVNEGNTSGNSSGSKSYYLDQSIICWEKSSFCAKW